MSTEETVNEKPFFITQNGDKYYFDIDSYDLTQMAKAGVEKRYRSEGQPIDPPTYEVTTVGGDIETHPHQVIYDIDKETGRFIFDENGEPIILKSTIETEEQQAEWDAHIAAKNKMVAEQNRLETEMYFESIQFDILPEWEEKHKRLNIEVPKDLYKKKLHFVKTEILKTADDFINALEKMQIESMRGLVPEGEISNLINSFRNTVQALTQQALHQSEESNEAS